MSEIITGSIVTYNTDPVQLQRVLGCCLATRLPIRLAIVDNSPSRMLSALPRDSRVDYIFSGGNLGYGRAHNIAMQKYDGLSKYHLALNPDVYFEPGALEGLYDFMEQNPDVAHVMPKVLYPSGELQYLCKLLPGPGDLIFRRFVPFRKLRLKRDCQYELRFTGYDKPMNIPYLSGCFMFFRHSAVKDIGWFDPRFFMYPEDVDITRRLHRKYRTMYFPDVHIIHDHAKDSYKSVKMLWVHMWNMIKYFNKWGWFLDSDRKRINENVLKQLTEAGMGPESSSKERM